MNFNLMMDIRMRNPNHYSALLVSKCGQVIHVYYKSKTDKTQLDIHEEECKKCIKITQRTYKVRLSKLNKLKGLIS